MPSFITHDVIIAGAGPVGLFLACELGLGGCSVLVLERDVEGHNVLKVSPFGLRGLTMPSQDGLDRRGLLSALRERGSSRQGGPPWDGQSRIPGGHFAGIPFFNDQIEPASWSGRRPAGMAALDLEALEAVLTERALALGVAIRRGQAVDGLCQDETGVTVTAGAQTCRGRWLVGCDGGRGAVRKAGGFTFVGTAPEFTGYSFQAVLNEPHTLQPGRQSGATGRYTYAPPGMITMVEFDGGAFHRGGALGRDHVEAVLRRVSGTRTAIARLDLVTTWTDRACQATEYRRGRVLLAGDAAHIHSPLGGQGLNLGLGDAMNLGWKLAATVCGHAPAALLDSYARERHPVGADVLDWSRAQVALMRPDRGIQALRSVVQGLMATREGARHVAARVWGTTLRYDLGGDHPLTGCSAPDVTLADGRRLDEHLRRARGLLLDGTGSRGLQALAARYGDRMSYQPMAGDEPGAMLVRPDGIVAWAGGSEPAEAAAAALRWFGTPASAG